MSIFAVHFRNHVTPRLRQQVALQAFLIACGSVTYGEGRAAIVAHAWRYGAGHLPAALFAELLDWISTALLEDILQAEPRVEAIEADNDRSVATDPVAHYTRLAAQCSNPDQMRWVFAAISPKYRAHLQAVRRNGR